MKIDYLKIIRDNLPGSLNYILGPLIRNRLLNNSEYLRYQNLLIMRENLSREEIQLIQFDKLKKILIHSYNYVPYYTELFNLVGFNPTKMKSVDEIQIIPFLTKELILKNFDKLISTKKQSENYYIATTGGSMGEPLKILLDYKSVFRENAFVYHFRKRIGYQIKDRLATFRGVEFGKKNWKYNPIQNELLLSPFKLSSKTITSYVLQINKFKPSFLNGYLSSLYYFAKLLSENNLKLNFEIRGIFLISENIDKEQRAFLETFFHVPSSTFYGHSERCIIAEEIVPNEYVFDPYYGYTEAIENTDSSHSIVGTGLLNEIMPLIRYKTDDNCFALNQRFGIQSLRSSTIGLYGNNMEFFTHSSLNFHENFSENIIRHQYIQTQKGKAELLLIVNNKFKLEEIALIRKELDSKMKNVIEFDIKIVDQLILSGRGKYKMIISNLDVLS